MLTTSFRKYFTIFQNIPRDFQTHFKIQLQLNRNNLTYYYLASVGMKANKNVL